MTSKTGFSIADIETQVARSEPAELEPFLPSGEPSGIVLLVLSDQAPEVDARLQQLRDERKRKELVMAAKASRSRPGETFIRAEDDDDWSRRLVIARLAGWRGLDDPFTAENAHRLLKAAPSFVSQILNKAAELGSFTKPSAKS